MFSVYPGPNRGLFVRNWETSVRTGVRGGGCSRHRTRLSPNSLLTGKRTGNFCRIRPREAIFARRQPANSMPCREIPYATEQGIIGAITGNFRQRTGNFLARTGSLSGRGQRAFRLHHRCNGRCRAGDAEASPSRSSLSVCPRRAQTSLACSALSQAQPAAMAAAGWSWCVSRFRRPAPLASARQGL